MVPYIGGKSYLARWIINNFPEDFKEKTYCEVFGGGGWVLFKKAPSFLEVYNDLNSDLVNLFRVIRNDFDKFKFKAEWSLHSRDMYLEALQKFKDDDFLNEVDRAMHYAIARMQCFAGKEGSGWAYAVKAEKITNGKWLPFLRRMEAINVRLKNVQIECLDYAAVIKKYDRANTFFYLDPPYLDKEYCYNSDTVSFEFNDHENLCKLLKGIKGKFLLSYYEHPVIREMYKDFKIITKEVPKHSSGITINSKHKKKPKAVELLIRNY